MAGDSQNLERSTLERKDRAELAAVAAALGLKVPSRAKKADIVTLILDVVAQPDAGGSARSGDTPAAPAEPTGRTGADDSSADDAGADDATADDAAPDGAAPAPSGQSSTSSASERPSAGGSRGNRSDRTSRGDSGNNGNRSGSGEAASPIEGQQQLPTALDEADRAPSDGDASGDDASASGDHDGNDSGDGENEGGGRNRRRRRRGRDRAEGEAGAGSDFEGEPVEVAGLLDLREDGYGFLRVAGFLPSRDDVYVSVKQCRQLGLRKGDHLTGLARPAGHKEKNPALTRVETVNGMDPEQARARPRFEDLVPVAPESELTFAGGTDDARLGAVVDALAPIAKGQRALVVAPPQSGRTTVLTTIARAIEANHSEVQLIVLLVDERPEDVTAFRRLVDAGEVVASTFDRPIEEHTAVAELTVEHAKRLVEYGYDVVILLDGLTRLARAYNAAATTGRELPGGLDAGALHPTKRFFGAARNIEDGGSLTMVATVAVDTGSALDAAIFEELEYTANRVLRLDGSAGSSAVDLDVHAAPAARQAQLDDLARSGS